MLASLTDRVSRSRRLRPLVEAGLLGLSSRAPMGTNVFEKEWDLLVVLDTCRYDALAGVQGEYGFLDGVGSIWSVGSSTREWSANTLTNAHHAEIARTAYVCGNGRVRQTLEGAEVMQSEMASRVTAWDTVSPSDFATFDTVPGYAPREPYGGLVTPDVVTDRAISVGRSRSHDRMIVHYIAPHNPYRANAIRENRDILDREHRPFDWLADGGDREVVWESYLDELRWALEYVEVLLGNVDAERAVITADHGDLFGHLGLYSHPTGVPHPALRRVPWAETTATDEGTYEPHLSPPDSLGIDGELQSQLERLGYA